MKKAVALLAILVLLLGSVAPSDAWGRHGRFHHGSGWWLPGAIIGGLVLGSVVAAVAAPYSYAPPPVVYEPAPVYAVAPPVYAAPAPRAPSVQREVIYPHGTYVLYGDGVTEPWQWVWVPVPPPSPPAPR
jgi:hypothetical protein